MGKPDDALSPEDQRVQALDLLNASHDFPVGVMVKIILHNETAYIDAAVQVIRDQLELSFDPPYRSRETKGGRHVSITLEPTFDSAEQLLDLYAVLAKADGVVMLL